MKSLNYYCMNRMTVYPCIGEAGVYKDLVNDYESSKDEVVKEAMTYCYWEPWKMHDIIVPVLKMIWYNLMVKIWHIRLRVDYTKDNYLEQLEAKENMIMNKNQD